MLETPSSKHELEKISFQPLNPDRWDDFVYLFGEKGAYGGCWCMWWRITRSQFDNNKNAGNKQAMKNLVDSGEIPGILAYMGDKAVGWCSVAPREKFGSLNRSPVLKRIDDKPVWSIVCLFLDKKQRGIGLAKFLVLGAIDYVRENGGRIIESYPYLTPERNSALTNFMGTPELFKQLGFVECARPSASKLIMRYHITEVNKKSI